jgi:hypothetical protein
MSDNMDTSSWIDLADNLRSFQRRLNTNDEILDYNASHYIGSDIIEQLQEYIIPAVAFLNGKWLYDSDYQQDNYPGESDYIRFRMKTTTEKPLILTFWDEEDKLKFVKLIQNQFSEFKIYPEIGIRINLSVWNPEYPFHARKLTSHASKLI